MMSTHKISIHYCPKDGVEWAEYVQSKLCERECQIDIALNDVTSDDMCRGRSRINIFLITPDFLDLIDLSVIKGFNHQLSLAILIGVDAENFRLIATQRGVHNDVKDWIIQAVDGSGESVRQLLTTIVTIYKCNVLPSRIWPVFKEIVEKGQKIYIGLNTKAESDVFVKLDGSDKELKAQYTNRYFYKVSLAGSDSHLYKTLSVMYKEPYIVSEQIKDLVPLPVQGYTHDRGLRLEHASSTFNEKQTKTQKLWELLKDETDPIRLLCQSMGLCSSERKDLDKKLADKVSVIAFQKHPCFLNIDNNSQQAQRNERWPTLLHFAAEYNLTYFTEAILSYSTLVDACKIRNLDGRTPGEIALHSGHLELCNMLSMSSHCAEEMRKDEREQNNGNVKEMLEHTIDSMRIPDDDQDTCIKLNINDSLAEEFRFVANPISNDDLYNAKSTKEKIEDERISNQKIHIREWSKPEEKKRSIFSRLLWRKNKPKEMNRHVSDGILDSVRKFQKKNVDIRRTQTQREFQVKRDSVIKNNIQVTATYSNGNEQTRAMQAIQEDAGAKSKKKFHIFFRNSGTRQSLRLEHAMKDKNISYPALPLKRTGHPSN